MQGQVSKDVEEWRRDGRREMVRRVIFEDPTERTVGNVDE